MKIGEYLIEQLQTTGLKHIFGIQGDYVLNFYSQLYKSQIRLINTCDEQSAGFAADGYARVAGFGAVCVTYGVGGLKLANSTAQAYAELSPVLVISGAPGMAERRHDSLLHHKIRSFETQLNVFKEMTVAQTVLSDTKSAANEINRVIAKIKSTKRPGYIELPRDMVDVEISQPIASFSDESVSTDKIAAAEVLAEVLNMITSAKQPIVITGAEVHRFGLQDLFLEFLECSGLQFVTGILGKSAASENHPQFIGIYAGGMSPDNVRKAVEDSDCVIAMGPYVSDLSTGMFTHHIDVSQSIVIKPHSVSVKHHHYPDVSMKYFLESLNKSFAPSKKSIKQSKTYEPTPFIPEPKKRITINRLIACVNAFLDDNITVIAEPGDPLFGALDLRVHGATKFISPAYYASIGFGIPAAIGVQFAAPDHRPLVLVGDGSFQMTGMELSVSARYGLNPIVIIFNNGGYGTFRPMIDGPFNDIQPWKYADIVKIIGKGKGYTVSTEDELSAALLASKENNSSPVIIDVHLDKHDHSERLKKLAAAIKNRIQ